MEHIDERETTVDQMSDRELEFDIEFVTSLQRIVRGHCRQSEATDELVDTCERVLSFLVSEQIDRYVEEERRDLESNEG